MLTHWDFVINCEVVHLSASISSDSRTFPHADLGWLTCIPTTFVLILSNICAWIHTRRIEAWELALHILLIQKSSNIPYLGWYIFTHHGFIHNRPETLLLKLSLWSVMNLFTSVIKNLETLWFGWYTLAIAWIHIKETWNSAPQTLCVKYGCVYHSD